VPTGPSGGTSGEAPAADPTQPAADAAVQPVQPTLPFEPAPLPEPLQAVQSGLVPPPGTEAAAPIMPQAPVMSGAIGSAQPSPVVPGAADAGLVVADTSRIFGRDAIPAFGAAVVAQAGLSASAALRINYDSNVALVPTGETLPPGSPFTSKDDVILQPSLNVQAGKNVGRQLFFLNTSIGKDFFLINEGIGRERISVNGGWQWAGGSNCSGRLQGGWSTQQVGSFAFADFEPGSQQLANFFTSASCQFGKFIPSITFDAGQSRFSDPGQQFSDSNFWGTSGSLGYAIGQAGQAGVQVNYREASFINQVIIPGIPAFGDNAVEILSLAGFFAYTYRARWSIDGSVGWTSSKNRNPLLRDFSGVTGQFSLAYSGPQWGAAFAFGRNANLGNAGGANLQVVTNLLFSGTYNINNRLNANAGVSWQRFTNFGDPRFVGIENLAPTWNFRVNGGLGYDLKPRVRLGLGASYFERTPVNPIFDSRLQTSAYNVVASIRINLRGNQLQQGGN
jgi:hypothetical protein